MARNKRNLEKVEDFVDRSVLTEGPIFMSDEDRKYWSSRVDEALEKAKAKVAAGERIEPPKTDPQVEEKKSDARKQLEAYIAGIARRRHADQPVPSLIHNHNNPDQAPLHLVSETKNTSDDSDSPPLHKLIKDLRRRLN